MDLQLKQDFLLRWKKYFGEAELPITFYYSDNHPDADPVKAKPGWGCIIADLSRVRNGESLSFDLKSVRCSGGKRYLGFSKDLRPGFEYFLSCGNDQMEGERYLRTPEMVKEMLKDQVCIPMEGKNIIFKRWDKLTAADHPEVVVFFAAPDVLSGLFTLANYDVVKGDGVITRFSSGCGSIIHHPWLEKDKEAPKAILGMFDPSARPYVPVDRLSFAVPMARFVRMIHCMDESFLITDTWKKMNNRLQNKSGVKR